MMAPPSVLLVDDEPLIRVAVGDSLTEVGLDVSTVATGTEALAAIAGRQFDVAVLDLRLPDMSGIDVLRRLRELEHATDVIMITAHGSIPTAVEAMKLGARDFLTKPFETAHLLEVIRRYLRLRDALRQTVTTPPPVPVCCGMIGQSPAMLELYRVIRAVADGTATILVRGETGTGKELAANAIHANSPRCDGPLVKVNCASVPEPLFESELYGSERGAFTGADRRRKGRFEMADRGTLFLDEVDEMPIGVQAKLLRSIQEKEIDRLGAAEPVRVDVRLIAATKVDLLERVRAGSFREDLYYRLNVLPVTLPPLRARGEDVQLLADHFLWRETFEAKRSQKRLTAGARAALQRYGWPGNVRELANLMARVVTLCPDQAIESDHLCVDPDGGFRSAVAPLSLSVQAEEDRRIDDALARTAGRKAEAAELLGISRKTLWEKLKRRGTAR
jgi:two-component system, NtrC family, response regulator AtoC